MIGGLVNFSLTWIKIIENSLTIPGFLCLFIKITYFLVLQVFQVHYEPCNIPKINSILCPTIVASEDALAERFFLFLLISHMF